jgi:hypothetical protein
MTKNIKVLKENKTGRNILFETDKGERTRAQLVKEIEKGKHPDYDVRNINGMKTPVSKPDGNKNNNLG